MLFGHCGGPITLTVALPVQKPAFVKFCVQITNIHFFQNSSPGVGEKILPVAVYYLQKCQK